MEGTADAAVDSKPVESAVEGGDSVGLTRMAADILVSILATFDPAAVVQS